MLDNDYLNILYVYFSTLSKFVSMAIAAVYVCLGII